MQRYSCFQAVFRKITGYNTRILEIERLQMNMLPEIHATQPIPFVHGFLGAPANGYMLYAGGWNNKLQLRFLQEFGRYPLDFRREMLDINSCQPGTANDGCRVITAMGKGEMIVIIFQVWLLAIHDPDLPHGKIRKQFHQQVSGCQVLEPFVPVMNLWSYADFLPEKIFIFRDPPNSYFCGCTDLNCSDEW